MSSATPRRFVGIQPRFPGFLARWTWLTEPIPAERVAALRIAAAAVLLIDVGVGMLPYFSTLFTAGPIRHMLYGVSLFDLATLGTTAALIALVVIAASFWPAWRAASIDAMQAMRGE